ncbi:15821_t:CDS:2 [Rhizophagus irregularis]|nr:15821_t:CDS:2 [Rhizophagus irregularis]
MDGSEDDLFGQDEKEEEIDKNEREIVDIDSDSADELDEFFFGKSWGGA